MQTETGYLIQLIPQDCDIVSKQQVFRAILVLGSLGFPAFYRESRWGFYLGAEVAILSGESVIPLDKPEVTYFSAMDLSENVGSKSFN